MTKKIFLAAMIAAACAMIATADARCSKDRNPTCGYTGEGKNTRVNAAFKHPKPTTTGAAAVEHKKPKHN